MTSATLKSVGPNLFLVEFKHCNVFDAFMFKNNVWNWLFTNTLAEFQISDEVNNGFAVKLTENRDAKNFINNFDKITFGELELI